MLSFGRRLFVGIAVAAAVALSLPAHAQIGSSTDILTGTVVRAEGRIPIKDAQVDVFSLDLEVTRRVRTNDKGRYTILFPDGGGQYRVTVRAIGLAPQTVTIARTGDEDRLVHDFVLTVNPTVLNAVQVTARQNAPRNTDAPTPGSTERAMNTDQAARLPLDASDLMQLVLTAPGIVAISGGDSASNQFSVAGLSPNANNVTLDGMSFGSSSVPQEAVRNTRVITSTYDVARGQFSGGQISSTTRSGSNRIQGNFSYSLRDRDLAIEEDPSPAAQGFTQNQFSGGFGGPIVKDRLFAFGSLQVRRRTDVLTSLANSDALTLSRFGVSPDSVDRFTGLLSSAGLSPFGVLADDRLSDNASGLLRLDYLTESGQSFALRADYRTSDQDPSRIGPLALPQTGGNNRNWGGGLLGSMTTNIAGRFLNELKIYAAKDAQEGQPFVETPAGRVQVNSDFGSGQSGISTLTFGGNTGLPQEGSTSTFEATNEMSWLSDGGSHRFKLGGLLNSTAFEQDVTTNRLGTFSFNSLEDFENNTPASFTRTLTPRLREGRGSNAALYLGDVWRVNRALQLNLGLRAEGSFFGNTPAFNPEIESKFGYRTDNVPTDFRLSPRVGFSWSVGQVVEEGRFTPPWFTLRGGIGEFRSAPSTGLIAAASGATGLPDNESQLVCIGADVPTPNWSAFAANPGSIPSQCASGGNSFIPTSRPNVTVFGEDFAAARAWRSNIGVSRRFLERFNLNADYSYSRGVAQPGYQDLNLRDVPQFALNNEGGRPVFVPASSVVPFSGATTFLASRVDPSYGQVLVTRSDLASVSNQFTLSLGGFTRRGASLNVSWTLANARDQGSGGGGGAGGGGGGARGGFGGGGGGFGAFGSPTTAGNPNDREWSTSSFQRKHTFVSTINYPINLGLEVTAFGRLSSGTPFTPLVGGDINGDGARNDRAFIFDPASSATDPAVAAGMSRLLTEVPSAVRQCLTRAFGAVAGRNTCTGVWQPSLDLQVNWRPNFLGLNRRLAVSFLTVNFLGALDQALHGSDNLSGWGQFRGQDNTLLYVRGFDATNNRYLYEVNERFGASSNGANAIPVPFQIGVNARYTLGPDRMREMIDGMIRGGGGGRGGFGGGGGGGGGGFPGGGGGFPGGRGAGQGPPGEAGARGPGFGGMNFNPVAQIIQLKDSLSLTAEQITRLQPLADSVGARNTALSEEMQKLLKEAGANPDMGALVGKLQPKLNEVRESTDAILKEVQQVLSKEQWDRLPPRLRSSGPAGPAGRRGRGGM